MGRNNLIYNINSFKETIIKSIFILSIKGFVF